MKRKISALILLALFLFTGCQKAALPSEKQGNGKKTIIATLFPQYDFAREIAKDKVDITLLLKPGMESHTFEPSPEDMVNISKCDLFLYTGDNMEPWAKGMLEGFQNDVPTLDVSNGVTFLEASGEEAHDAHAHGLDPHIWTDPQNASIMVKNIADKLCEIDPDNEEFYRANEKEYLEKLTELDEEFEKVVSEGKRKTIVFGGRFALSYFAKAYDLEVVSAYDSCSEESEPSASVVAKIVDLVKTEKIPVIYYEEMTDPKVAKVIAEETNTKILLLHSTHNLSKDEFDQKESYLSLMEQNVVNLKEGLA